MASFADRFPRLQGDVARIFGGVERVASMAASDIARATARPARGIDALGSELARDMQLMQRQASAMERSAVVAVQQAVNNALPDTRADNAESQGLAPQLANQFQQAVARSFMGDRASNVGTLLDEEKRTSYQWELMNGTPRRPTQQHGEPTGVVAPPNGCPVPQVLPLFLNDPSQQPCPTLTSWGERNVTALGRMLPEHAARTLAQNAELQDRRTSDTFAVDTHITDRQAGRCRFPHSMFAPNLQGAL